MSYFSYPKLHFSGRFKASPSTINNTPNNYDPTIYPSPNELQNVELYWNPKGDGGFAFVDCVVTRVDYADGTFSITSEQDPIIGQPVASLPSPSFPLQGALVDLDPMQQNVSEIWAMTVQIGGASNLTGSFSAISFYAIWGQAQGQAAPHSSASGSGVYQSTLRNTQLNGGPGGSKFLQHFADNPTANLSINFNVNTHNNAPPMWRFNDAAFEAMRCAQPPVPDSVLAKIKPMQQLVQNLKEPDGNPATGTPAGPPRGDVPAQDFVLFMLKQYLSTQEYNANINTILEKSALKYTPSTSEDFLYGLTTGTIGSAAAGDPTFFVANRMMNPQPPSISGQQSNPAWYVPFMVSEDGKTIHLNLGNSLPTELPGTTPWAEKLGTLSLVTFSGNIISAACAQKLFEIPYQEDGFMTQRAGGFSATVGVDCSTQPLGIMSEFPGTEQSASVILAEHPQGYYLRADQFVFRLNPGIPTTPAFPRGETTTAEIYALQWGKPVPDGTAITVTMMTPQEAAAYTENTLGTGGTNGINGLSTPRDALKINGQIVNATASTSGGVAQFDLSCTPPGNPRGYVNGQIYFLNYAFADPSISAGYIQDADDLLSVLVYDAAAEAEGPDILAKFGRLYKIMSFLTDPAKAGQIDLRNMIKLLLERPFTEITHMPVTRDIAEAERAKVIAWIDALNNS